MSITPGLWRAGSARKGSNYGDISAKVIAIGHGALTVAKVYGPLGPNNEEMCNANAHLIAAAPEMLAALEGVVRVADRATVEFDLAREAIAKARGTV